MLHMAEDGKIPVASLGLSFTGSAWKWNCTVEGIGTVVESEGECLQIADCFKEFQEIVTKTLNPLLEKLKQEKAKKNA